MLIAGCFAGVTKIMIIRLGVKFIEMMFSLKNGYDSLQHHRLAHVVTIMTEATALWFFAH